MNKQPEWVEDINRLEENEGRYWTLRRILITLIILVTLIAFLVYTIAPALLPPAPPPPPRPPLQGV
jgi:hypothetical protein